MIDIEKIRKDPNNQNWYDLCFEEELKEDFIREFQEYVYWGVISWNQSLSKEFIVEFSNKIKFECILDSELISYEVKEFCKMFL